MMGAREIQGIVDTVAGVDAGAKVLSVVQAPDGALQRVDFGWGAYRARVFRSPDWGGWLVTVHTPQGVQTLKAGLQFFADAVTVAARHLADGAPSARTPQHATVEPDGAVMADTLAVGRALAEVDAGEDVPCEVPDAFNVGALAWEAVPCARMPRWKASAHGLLCYIEARTDGVWWEVYGDPSTRIGHGGPLPTAGEGRAARIAALECARRHIAPPPTATDDAPLTAKEAWGMVATLDHEAGEARQRVWAALGLDDEASVDEMVAEVERLREVADAADKERAAFEKWRLMAAADARSLLAAVSRGMLAAVHRSPPPDVRPQRPRPPVCFKMPGDTDHADRRTFAAGDDPTQHLDWSDDDE